MHPLVTYAKFKYLIVCSFSELNLNGLKLSKPVVNSLCQLASTSCLTNLMLGSTGIGTVSILSAYVSHLFLEL